MRAFVPFFGSAVQKGTNRGRYTAVLLVNRQKRAAVFPGFHAEINRKNMGISSKKYSTVSR